MGNKVWLFLLAFWLVMTGISVHHSHAQEPYSIRCSVGFNDQSERYYVYARLTVDSGDRVEGSWYYFDKVHNQSFREIGDHDVSFLKVGNDPGKTTALIRFDGIVNGTQYILEDPCTFTREGIDLQVTATKDGVKATGKVLYGNQAAGKWHFQIFDHDGQEKASAWYRQNGETASHQFEALPPGTYQAQLTFEGAIKDEQRILKDAYQFQVSPENSSTPSGNTHDPKTSVSGNESSQNDYSPLSVIHILILSVVAVTAGIIVWMIVYRKM